MKSFAKGVVALILGSAIAVTAFVAFTHVERAGAPAPSGATLRPATWPSNALTIATLGHATLLMNYFGVRVISDPTLFNRIGLALDSILTIGPHRMVPPPMRPTDLQSIDLILITHAHMDHLDIPSLKALPKSAVVVACKGCGDLIKPLGFADVRTLGWGDQTVVRGLVVTAMPARHWGRRWPWERDRGYNSYVLEKDGHRMLLACDSAYTSVFSSLGSNPTEVAAFSIGAYDPWIWNHADPEQVWRMFIETGAKYLVPIHWGTFRLSKEPVGEPIRRLVAAAGNQSSRIVLRTIGSAWTMPSAPIRSTRATSAPLPAAAAGNRGM